MRATSLTLLVLLPLVVGCPSRPDADPDGQAPEFLTDVLPPGEVGARYHAVLAAHKGTEPRTFGVPAVPSGFSFYPSTGVLEGTPREAGTFPLTFTVTDAHGRTSSRGFSLVIHPEGPPTGGDDGGDEDPDDPEDPEEPDTPPAEDVLLDIANWNVEWFGSIYYGPVDEALQLEGVAEVIRADGTPIWAMVEITDGAHFHALVSRLSTLTGTGWEGVVANDPSVTGGTDSYDTYEQKPALLWKKGTLSAVEADVILSEHDYTFAGRPPLRVRARLHAGDATSDVTFVVLHLKAKDQPASQERRLNAAYALRNWLQAQPDTEEILVLGDWNDDLDASISIPLDTPFLPLLQEPDLTFLTQRLTDHGISTTTWSGGEPIDHQLATRCLTARYVTDSVWVEKTWPNGYVYRDDISDHYPVRSTFRFNPDWQPCD